VQRMQRLSMDTVICFSDGGGSCCPLTAVMDIRGHSDKGGMSNIPKISQIGPRNQLRPGFWNFFKSKDDEQP
jgi:hypothetical protein